MSPRRIALVVIVATGLAAGWNVFLALTRWEWNRAIVAMLVFLAAEIGLFGSLALQQLANLRRDLESRPPARREPDPSVLLRVRESAPAPRRHFSWLDPRGSRTSVFLPILLSAGIIVSAIAWAVERLARHAAMPSAERDLTRRLEPISLPREGLLLHEHVADPLAVFTPRSGAGN